MKTWSTYLMLCCLLVGALGGCGYTSHTKLPGDITSIYVPNFKNKVPLESQYSHVPGIESALTNAVIDRFIYDGTVKVEKKENADALLIGDIIRYEQEPVSYTRQEGVEQYRLFIVVSLQLVKASTGEVIWKEDEFTGRTEYYVEGALATRERVASSSAVTDLAKKIVDRVVEDW